MFNTTLSGAGEHWAACPTFYHYNTSATKKNSKYKNYTTEGNAPKNGNGALPHPQLMRHRPKNTAFWLRSRQFLTQNNVTNNKLLFRWHFKCYQHSLDTSYTSNITAPQYGQFCDRSRTTLTKWNAWDKIVHNDYKYYRWLFDQITKLSMNAGQIRNRNNTCT